MNFEKELGRMADRYREIERSVTLLEIIADMPRYTALMKEYKKLTPLHDAYVAYTAAKKSLHEAEDVLKDPSADGELTALAAEERNRSLGELQVREEEIRILLLPHDPEDDRNVVMEIRQGTGGEEAALFAADLFRMYSMYMAAHGFSVHVTGSTPTELGGYKDITFTVGAEGAYARVKYESGVHRVQRIPKTESGGRIQTSAVTVAVLPEVEDVEVHISPSDVVFETCKSSGAGGQHINKTESAVRLTHKPSGLVVECDSERSQLQNRETAMRILRARLFAAEEKKRDDAIASSRKAQVGGGDRSEKIRTYNYPQSRVTDHRIGKTLYSLDRFMNGDMDEMLSALAAAEIAEKLKGQTDDN